MLSAPPPLRRLAARLSFRPLRARRREKHGATQQSFHFSCHPPTPPPPNYPPILPAGQPAEDTYPRAVRKCQRQPRGQNSLPRRAVSAPAVPRPPSLPRRPLFPSASALLGLAGTGGARAITSHVHKTRSAHAPNTPQFCRFPRPLPLPFLSPLFCPRASPLPPSWRPFQGPPFSFLLAGGRLARLLLLLLPGMHAISNGVYTPVHFLSDGVYTVILHKPWL